MVSKKALGVEVLYYECNPKEVVSLKYLGFKINSNLKKFVLFI